MSSLFDFIFCAADEHRQRREDEFLRKLVARLQPIIVHEVAKMSASLDAKIDQLDAKVETLTSTNASLAEHIAAQNAKLNAAETARDAAVTELTTTQAALTAAQTELAQLPHDTSAAEARLQTEIDKIGVVIDNLNSLDAAPVPAPDPSPAVPTPETDPSTTV